MENYLDIFRKELKNRNYAYKTIKAYTRFVKNFLEFSEKTDLEPEARVREFVHKQNGQEQRRLAYSAIIATLYSSGLRVSEVVKLKVKDIDIDKLLMTVRRSKQHKDRITIISEKLVPLYKPLIKDRKPNEYLFTTISGKKYSTRTQN